MAGDLRGVADERRGVADERGGVADDERLWGSGASGGRPALERGAGDTVQDWSEEQEIPSRTAARSRRYRPGET